MFYRFKPSRKPAAIHAASGKAARLIFQKIARIQRRVAGGLNLYYKRQSQQKLKTFWLLFAASGLAAAGSLVFQGFTGSSLSSPMTAGRGNGPGSLPVAGPSNLRQLMMELYLDSLEKAFIQDSIRISNQNRPAHELADPSPRP